jgi:hypothetical protein
MKNRSLRYNRISSVQQNLDRQQQRNHEYEMVFEDRCSGTIPLFERPYGKEIKSIVENGEIDYEYYREKASRESSEQFAMMFVYDMLIYCQVNPEEISIKDLIPLINFFKGRVMKIYYLLKD